MTSLTPRDRDAVKVAIVLQAFAMLLRATLLDGGTLARAGGCAIVGFWVGVVAIVHRRPRSPSEIDLLYVRWGFLATLVVACCASPWMGAPRR